MHHQAGYQQMESQSIAVVVSPIDQKHQPAGIFAYWLPAASFGTVQLLLFRHSALVRRAIGLPPRVIRAAPTAPK